MRAALETTEAGVDGLKFARDHAVMRRFGYFFTTR